MKILTWNVNGIRAMKLPLKELLDSLNSDVICLQETKITRNMLDSQIAQVDGYNAYFSFSRKRTGYSGVVTYCRDNCVPSRAEDGLSGHMTTSTNDGVGFYSDYVGLCKDELIDLDSEGRAVITQHHVSNPGEDPMSVCIINVYCPRADPEREDRIEYKHNFYRLLQARSETLIHNNCHVIIVGDINATHQEIDHCNPTEQSDENLRGRLWIDQMLCENSRDVSLTKYHESENETEINHVTGGHFIDTYRHLHPDQLYAYTNWSQHTGARLTNYGRRLDYIFLDKQLTECLKECEILSHVQGSDHCPVVVDLSIKCQTSMKCPSFCSKYLPEVIGKQKKLSSYFTKRTEKCDSSSADRNFNNLEKNNSFDDQLEVSSSQESITSSDVCKTRDIIACESGLSNLKASMIESSSQNSLKRVKSVDTHSGSKRAKLTKEKSAQPSLMSFFNKKNSSSATRVVDKIETTPIKCDKSADSRELERCNENISSFDVQCKNKISLSNDVEISMPKSQAITGENSSKSDSKQSTDTKNTETAQKWKRILSGPPPPPMCKGHNEPCVLRTVKKADSYNKGRQFYVCAKPQGLASNPQSRCNHFDWIK